MSTLAVVLSFALTAPTRVRVAGALDKSDEGVCTFVANGRIYNNAKYDSRWRTFAEGTRFDVIAIIDKTDTYCLLATETLIDVLIDDSGNKVTKTHIETNGVFLRRQSYDKLLTASRNAEELDVAIAANVKDEAALLDFAFGTPVDEIVVSARAP